MRVTKSQIVRGVSDYIRDEIIPKMNENKALQILASVAVGAAAGSEKTLDALFQNDMIRALLDDDGSGTYDIGSLMDKLQASIGQYGTLPVQIPPVPFLSPREITLRLDAGDIDAMRRRIEAGAASA